MNGSLDAFIHVISANGSLDTFIRTIINIIVIEYD
jgi:hypothetical protein